MKVAILGYGVVGKEVFKQIKDKYEVVKILDNRETGILFTSDIDEIINLKPDTVIECLPNIDVAYTYEVKVLENKINLVSSNKAIVQKHYEELVSLANKNNVHFSFEAAVGGGIPNLHTLLSSKTHDTITHIKGIMNGTTNYILDSVFNNNMSYETALDNAIKLGYAEADYSSDVDGIDVAYKVALSLNLAYETIVNKDLMDIYGIRYLNDLAIKYAKDNNLVIKLIGYGDKENAFVLPMFIDKKEVFANIPLNYNCIEIGSLNQDSIKLIGQGAGGAPTADSMVNDLVNPFPALSIDNELNIKNTKKFRFYISNKENETITDPLEVNKLKDLVKTGYFVGGIYD